MIPTENRYHIDEQKIIIFGAGKIGRSFIGQLFARGGYKVVFVDINSEIIGLLNTRGFYRVITKSDTEEEIIVSGVSGISASDEKAVADAVATAGIIAVSVGKNAVEKVIPLIAKGLILRNQFSPGHPIDIIIAENMIAGGDFMRQNLKKNLPADYPFEEMIGLIETSIGKMVPIMSQADLDKDPLMVFAEPYNTLILDAKAFKTPIPDIEGLAPKNNIKAWVDRKAFIHNLGHATAAYYGHFNNPDAEYMFEVLNDTGVFKFTRNVMMQSAEVLLAAYSGEFTKADLESHIDDLLLRFSNKFLKDTVFRVGHDLTRKLSADDRFMGAIKLARIHDKPFDRIVEALSYGFVFKAKDDAGDYYEPDLHLLESASVNFEETLINILKFEKESDKEIIQLLKKYVDWLKYF